MSRNTLDALDQTNASHTPLAMRAIQSIADSALSFQSAQGANAHYATVNGGLTNGGLTVHARLNEQSRYDVISISSPTAATIYLSVPPPPATTHHEAPSVTSEQPPSPSSHLAAQYSRGQLARAMIQQNNPQDFSDKQLPSGTSVSTQSMVFSQDGSTGASTGVPGPSRTRLPQTARSEPSPASSQSGASSSRGRNAQVPDPAHPGQTISRSQRNSRQQVDDPAQPGQTISRSLRNNRQLVDDPAQPGQTISRSQRSGRQLVDDPAHPGQTISRDLRKNRQQVDDPAQPGQTISRSQLNTRNSRARAAARAARAAEAENA